MAQLKRVSGRFRNIAVIKLRIGLRSLKLSIRILSLHRTVNPASKNRRAGRREVRVLKDTPYLSVLSHHRVKVSETDQSRALATHSMLKYGSVSYTINPRLVQHYYQGAA